MSAFKSEKCIEKTQEEDYMWLKTTSQEDQPIDVHEPNNRIYDKYESMYSYLFYFMPHFSCRDTLGVSSYYKTGALRNTNYIGFFCWNCKSYWGLSICSPAKGIREQGRYHNHWNHRVYKSKYFASPKRIKTYIWCKRTPQTPSSMLAKQFHSRLD